jgi:hypothetical protein
MKLKLKAQLMKPKDGTSTPPPIGIPAKIESAPVSTNQDNKMIEEKSATASVNQESASTES